MPRTHIEKIMKKLLFFMLLLAFNFYAYAQSTANYTFSSATNGSLTDMSSGTTQLVGASVDDGASAPASDIGFDFVFMGIVYSQFSANSNGQMRLGSTTISGGNQSPASSVPILAPIGADNKTSATGKVHYKLSGSSPNRVLVVEWKDLIINYNGTGTTAYNTFQVKLYETIGKIEYVYGRMINNSTSAQSINVFIASSNTVSTVGWIGTINTTPTYNTSATLTATSFTASSDITNLNSTADGSRTIFTFTPPDAPSAPTNLTFSAVSGTGMTLNWTDNATTETSYIIMRSDDGTNYSNIASLAANSASYAASGLNFGTTYYWKVLAINEGRSSEISASQATNPGTICGSKNIGPGGDYASLNAAFTDINTNGLACNVNLILQSDYVSSVETFPIAGPNSAPMGTYTATIYPSVTGLSITSANTTGTINLNGSRNVIFDGRVNANGTTNDLVIENTHTSGYAINFINDANNNTIKYCNIKGVNTGSGVVVFSTTTGITGNDNNTIENCNLTKGASKPKYLVYSAGTPSKENSGNTIRNCNFYDYDAATSAAGIYISSNSTDWTISNNSFYQTEAYAGSSGTIYGIYINTGNNHSVTGNYIGGTQASCGGSAWTINGTAAAYRFVGIYMNLGTTTASSVQDNTIANFDWLCSSGGVGSVPGIWAGIYVHGGSANIGNVSANTIGNMNSVESIKITTTSTGSVSSAISSNSSSPAVVRIVNNNLGSISTLGNSTSISNSFIGIWTTSTATYEIENNKIGSETVENSINAANPSVAATSDSYTGSLQYVIAIQNTGASTNVLIKGNTMANINNAYVPSTARTGFAINGIRVTAGVNQISENTIFKLTTTANSTASGHSASIVGIANVSSTAGQIIEKNTIYNLSNSNTTAACNIVGIAFSGATTGNSFIRRNFIYNIETASSSTSARIDGLNITGRAVVSNNMIRLGYKIDGSSITNSIQLYGIYETNGSNGSAMYHNSVYIGGENVSATVQSTYALYSLTTQIRTYQNNVFVNNRSNNTTGGKHYAILIAGSGVSPSGLLINYNIYQASGTGGVLGLYNGGDRTTLQAWRAFTGHDLHSAIADPQFIDPTATTPNLHIKTDVATPVKGSGIFISDITDDFDGDTRSSESVHIGADAGNFHSLDDRFTPNISYTPLSNGSGDCSPIRTLTATITDVGTGVPTSGSNVPRVWFNKNGGSWHSSSGTLSSGDGNNGVWNFDINYTTLGTVASTDIVRYYVAAQDQFSTPNVWYTAFEATSPLHSSVDVQTAAPTTPNSYTIVPTLNGTYTIGAAANYATLTAAGGLFEAINNGVVTGNIIANITTDITETGAISLNQWIEDCGSAYTLTIQPSDANPRVISATALSSGTPLVNINGADRVIINGTEAKLLTLRNSNATASNTGPTIQLTNSSENCEIINCIVENNGSSSSRGCIVVGTGNNSVKISNNELRNTTAGTIGNPFNAIYVDNASSVLEITNNSIFNWTNFGVNLNRVADNCVITGNSFYNNLATPLSVAQTSIKVSTGQGHDISNNYIGGQSSSCGGSAWTNSGSVIFTGINVQVGNAIQSKIENNTIQNISMTSTSSPKFEGIKVNTTNPNSNVLVKGNTIGHATTASSVLVAGNAGSYIYGIYSMSEEPNCLFESNLIANLTLNSSAENATISAMKIETGDVKKNKIYKLGRSSGTNYLNIDGLKFDAVASAFANEVSNNMISLTTSGLDKISGINDAAGDQVRNYYYNTVYVYGTASASFSMKSYAMNKNNSTDKPHRNNLFINTITGGNGSEGHLAYSSLSSNFSTDYNLIVATDNSKALQFGAGSIYQELITWKTAGRDNSSWYYNPTAGSSNHSNINIANLFVDAANGNLNINTANPEAWYVFGKGIAGPASGNIDTDFNGNARITTPGYATCIGAHQFSQPVVAPISANQTGTLGNGNTTTYSFGNRTLCEIDWTNIGSITALDIKLYSGVNPPNPLEDYDYHNYYIQATPTGGGAFEYTMKMHFDTAFFGAVNPLSEARLAKYDSQWNVYSDVSCAPQSVTCALFKMHKTGLNSFSDFTGARKQSTLPVEYLSIQGKRSQNQSFIFWTTSSEINNDYFDVLRSEDAVNFYSVGMLNGAGNSNTAKNYQFTDIIPDELINSTLYYIIKQVDFDGKSKKSSIIPLLPNMNADNSKLINAWTQENKLLIDFYSSENETVKIQIFDINGKIVYAQNIEMTKGNNSIYQPLNENLNAGIYLLRITNNHLSEIKKINIQK